MVPQPVKNPNPTVAAAESDAVMAGPASGYVGSNAGTSNLTRNGLVINPASVGKFSSSSAASVDSSCLVLRRNNKPGFNRHVRKTDEMPKTRPLCRSRPKEPLKRRSAPRVVWIGVNMAGRRSMYLPNVASSLVRCYRYRPGLVRLAQALACLSRVYGSV